MATVKRNDSEAVQLEKSDIQVIEDVKSMDGLDSIEDTKPGAFVWLCAAATAIGGMLFGCKDHSHPTYLSTNTTDIVSQTIQVSFQVFSSSSELISAAKKSQTPRRKPSLPFAPQERLLVPFLLVSLPTSMVASLLSGSQASSS
jgi:hypothetical protein